MRPAIAIAYLCAEGTLPQQSRDIIFLGELALDGHTRYTKGILPILESARRTRMTTCYIPYSNRHEASLVEDLTIFPVRHLQELIEHILGTRNIKIEQSHTTSALRTRPKYDFCDIRGNEHPKRALTISAIGKHNIALIGPPGTGKSMLAYALLGITPDLMHHEALEVAHIQSVLSGKPYIYSIEPPFAHPHHTCSVSALLGGGSHPMPGEITRAHKGILFLDEFPEFNMRVVESLRQPLEDFEVNVLRQHGRITFPADTQTVIALNPCPCGYHGSRDRPCTCTPHDISRYTRKISGPIVDRIDMWVPVEQISYEKLLGERRNDQDSMAIREMVRQARTFGMHQRHLHIKHEINPKKIITNSRLSVANTENLPITPQARDTLITASKKLGISARGIHKTLRVALSIADLEHLDIIMEQHILEALQYRPCISEEKM